MTAMPHDQRDELLAGRALGDLTPEETREVDRLLLTSGEDDGYDLLAAELDLALLTEAPEAPPAALLQRLHAAADEFVSPRGAGGESAERAVAGRIDRSPGPLGPAGVIGWIAAAACLLLAALAWIPFGDPEAPALSYAELAERSDAMTVGLTADLAGEQPVGSLVWSESAQSGVMRFEGLPAIDPDEEVYQLWIFDASRERFEDSPLEIRHPVDGGVFAVTGPGAVEVPIEAKLPVGRPVLFAVTIEPPGGVVVSDRSRIAAVGIPG